MKEEACFGAGLCEGFSGESEILVFFVVEELPAFCNDRVCRVKRRCPVIPLVKWLGRLLLPQLVRVVRNRIIAAAAVSMRAAMVEWQKVFIIAWIL